MAKEITASIDASVICPNCGKGNGVADFFSGVESIDGKIKLDETCKYCEKPFSVTGTLTIQVRAQAGDN